MSNDARPDGLLAWQWSDYADKHRDTLNLWIHLYAVPAFIGGCWAALSSLLSGRWLALAASLAVVAVAFLLQGLGHRREAAQPAPFAGPGDVLARVFAEQFITFPRFVLSGGWIRNLSRRNDS